MGHNVRKLVLGFPTRSDTNRDVQPHNMARGLKFQILDTICVAKTKALISCGVNAQLICLIVFANANSFFSHNTAHKVLHDF